MKEYICVDKRESKNEKKTIRRDSTTVRMVRLTEEMVVARTRMSDLTAVKKLNCWQVLFFLPKLEKSYREKTL